MDVFTADMSSQAEVRRLAGEVLDAYPRLDVLVNNVGGFWAHRHVTADGLEHTFALNHLAPFLLTNLLLDRLKASAPARVVTVSSGAHATGRIDFDGRAEVLRTGGIQPMHLKDVYWTQEGRTSIDAMVMGVALAGLFLVSSAPFDANARDPKDSKTVFFALLAFNVLFAIITFLKKKPILGVIAIFVPRPVGWFAGVRLAKPGSPWAHMFYDPDRGRASRRVKRERKLKRSRRRFEEGRLGRFERWFSDLVGGKTDLPSPGS